MKTAMALILTVSMLSFAPALAQEQPTSMQQQDADFEAATARNRAALAANTAKFEALLPQLQAANIQLAMLGCEHTWHRTMPWTKLLKYHGHDPCWKGLNDALKESR